MGPAVQMDILLLMDRFEVGVLMAGWALFSSGVRHGDASEWPLDRRTATDMPQM